MKRVVLSWSSGKDSAWALSLLRKSQDLEVTGLLTTVNQAFDRVAMHAVRRSLLESQAKAAGLPLRIIPLPWPCANRDYERVLTQTCVELRQSGVDAIAFGDLFLRDIREYREKQLASTGLEPLFPLWALPTCQLARDMIEAGLRAKLTCVDPRHLAGNFAGRDFDSKLLADLPAGVDPCGENGEFHTFAYAGPMFQHPLPVDIGEITARDEFVFADVLPAAAVAG
jgi:uncharacterized protein (TIGR00290 family)